jgi:hypothetical protein
MTYAQGWRYGSGFYDDRLPVNARPQRVLAGAALGCVAFACAWTLAADLIGGGEGKTEFASVEVVGTRGDRLEVAATRGDRLAIAIPAPQASSAVFASLFDPHLAMGAGSSAFVRSAPVVADSQPAEPAIAQAQAAAPPQAPVRQAEAAPARPATTPRVNQIRTALLHDAHRGAADAGAWTAKQPSIFAKLFGKQPSVALAYAAPDDGGLASGVAVTGLYDRETAVYDIAAHKVYLPDGTTLEAHSGLGSLLDDPRHADVKDRGVTPPAVYDLEEREALFHGVRALRMIPEDEGKVFGRTGILAHTYMLGPNGDSNGCVSFKDYGAFLQAFDNHEIKRLAVVASLD